MATEHSTVPTGVLVMRVWLEGEPPTALRARVTTAIGVAETEHPMTAVATVDEACAAVRRWLIEFVSDGATSAPGLGDDVTTDW